MLILRLIHIFSLVAAIIDSEHIEALKEDVYIPVFRTIILPNENESDIQ
jgi:hypothetical protein